MEEDILSAILGTEKEIEELVGTEREKTAQWLESEKRAIEREMEAEARKLRDSLDANVEEARKAAEKRAAAIVEQAAEQRRLLSELDDGTLERIISEHIARILPGRDHDIEDVQS